MDGRIETEKPENTAQNKIQNEIRMDAVVDAALRTYPTQPLPDGFAARVKMRLPRRSLPQPTHGEFWRLSPSELTLVVFFTVFWGAIAVSALWMFGATQPDLFAQWVDALQFWNDPFSTTQSPTVQSPNGEPIPAALWWALISGAIAVCQVGAIALWYLWAWDRAAIPTDATRPPSV